MPDLNTRQAILTYLSTHPSATTSEMALDLGVGAADVRYHIACLIRENRVQTTEPPPGRLGRRGRPERYLRLTVEQQDNNYQALASALLALAQESDRQGDPPLELVLASRLTTGFQVSRNMPRRLANAIQFLQSRHYHAVWEARIQGPRILLHNCPYAAIWPEFPLLCAMDKHLLEILTGLEVDCLETILPETGNRQACVFQAHHPNPAGK